LTGNYKNSGREWEKSKEPQEVKVIELRLFSYISKNWRGKPLITLELIVQLIANATTEKRVDSKSYER
jgi:hypothetical protein